MIGPGSMPRFLRPLGRKRIFAYRRRRVKRRSPQAAPRTMRPMCDAQDVLFDLGKSELPTATLAHKRESPRTLLGALSAWLLARWQWLTPRAVPVVVAMIGMVLVLLSAHYLTHWQFEPLPSWHR